MLVPSVIAAAGESAGQRTLEFFTARIPNPHTRKAYGHAVFAFCAWLDREDVALGAIQPTTVAVYLALLEEEGLSLATVKLKAAGLRHWLDYLTEKGVLTSNPALSVRTRRLVMREGKTPIFEKSEARALFEMLSDEPGLLALRDRAICALMLYPPFARVGAVVKMQVRDFEDSREPFIALHEKGGVERREACHHKTADYLRAYLDAAPQLRSAPREPLFQSAPRRRAKLSGKAMLSSDAWMMIKRRCKAAGLSEAITCHSFRASGITYHQEAGGELKQAQRLAGHASPATTSLYDRSSRKVDRAEVERVQL
jgi:site-specific recombinase XerD